MGPGISGEWTRECGFRWRMGPLAKRLEWRTILEPITSYLILSKVFFIWKNSLRTMNEYVYGRSRICIWQPTFPTGDHLFWKGRLNGWHYSSGMFTEHAETVNNNNKSHTMRWIQWRLLICQKYTPIRFILLWWTDHTSVLTPQWESGVLLISWWSDNVLLFNWWNPCFPVIILYHVQKVICYLIIITL